MIIRAKDIHLGGGEELGGSGREEEESGWGNGGCSLKEAIKERRVAMEICGSGGRAAAVFSVSSSEVSSATFLLVVSEVFDVPIVLMESMVPTEALEAIESPELFMVDTSSCALMRTFRSSLLSSIGTSAGMMPLVMSWILSISRSSSFLSWAPLIILVDLSHVDSSNSFWASLVARPRRIFVSMFFVSLKQ